ncbi:hypothetical protein [Thioalkalivibrio sp. HK1]|uniref:hypothetical protein n=1 Tax=Thioalkalivibrio sp. HK1 TaxID=1469245 RepID=UPI0012DD2A4A|nr:hypothetical protein [Thioalkalivibrio sp. HK1]
MTKTLKNTLLALGLGLPLICGSAYGEEVPSYILESIRIKTEDPQQMNYRLYVKDRCPIDTVEARRIVRGIIADGGIEPVQETLADDGIYLLMAIDCIPDEGEMLVYRIGTMFGWVQQDQGVPPAPALIGWPFGSFGSGDSEALLEVFEESVEKAVNAYRSANEGA